ncbi:response regulator transcription factor [Coraliomargarita parva]|uniref:response regulator transcription factor n=1 Tax=Coraliomargarita parva TaxID=3014050 RepID=UPI0022B3D364|nr:response regulator transcription factor [Coraliomargarita parva]
MRILLIEDYEPLRRSVVELLESHDYAVDASASGDEGLWYASNHDYDVIVLDLMLPKVDGLSILRRLRQAGSGVPIIVISARDSVDHRIEGLDAGADDYLVKPFALKELLARVRAQTRKAYEKKAALVEVGDLSIDLTAKRVTRHGSEIQLTSREYSLLEYLAYRAGEVVSRQEIWDHVYNYYEDASSNAVDVYVGYLRKKLASDDGGTYIQTRRGQGYLLEYVQA